MGWIFETYSGVYNTAMMQDMKPVDHVAGAKSKTNSIRGTVSRLFGRS